MKPRTIQFIFYTTIIIAGICSCVYLYCIFGPNPPIVEHTAIVLEGICSIIILILVITKKKWDKQDSDKS